MAYMASNQTILLNGQFLSAHAAQTILAKSGVNLTTRQISARNANRTLHDRSLDKPINAVRIASGIATQKRKRQEMIELIARIDAAKLKLSHLI